MQSYKDVIANFPKRRQELPEAYRKIYDEHYERNRKGQTKVSFMAMQMEKWLHKKVASTAKGNLDTLEIGSGTLNQLNFEVSRNYDIVEPYHRLYQDSPNLSKVRNFYNDISDVPGKQVYDRIISIASFEHICNLPDVVAACSRLLKDDGVLGVSIPNEGRFLWHFAYTMTTGREFKKKYGLDYERLMRYEHVNSADEIEIILRHFFSQCIYIYIYGNWKDVFILSVL